MDKQVRTPRTRKLQKGRRFGQVRPQTPSGEVKRWKSPSKGTTPADRKRDAQ